MECGVDGVGDRIEEEVARLFFEKADLVIGSPWSLLRIANGYGPGTDILRRRREEWGVYLDGLSGHGVRRLGRVSFMVTGVGVDEIAVLDPLSDSSVIIVPREFGFRMVVLGGLP
jgi:hypothetical protein